MASSRVESKLSFKECRIDRKSEGGQKNEGVRKIHKKIKLGRNFNPDFIAATCFQPVD